MNYAVTVHFELDGACESAPLASFRGEVPGEGWVIRLDNDIVSAVSSLDGHTPVRARIRSGSGLRKLEWRVTGDRHELWLDGAPSAECMSRLDLGDADTLRHGEDPGMPGKTYTGVLSVEVTHG
jgi:hypothetical protein